MNCFLQCHSTGIITNPNERDKCLSQIIFLKKQENYL